MSPLLLLQLVGHSIGAVLPLWMGAQLVSHRHNLTALERILFALALTMGGWHASNLFIAVHVGLGFEKWTTLLRIADSISVVSITFAYSFLLHVHLHFWADSNGRPLTRNEKIRVYLSYLPTLFLLAAVPMIWTGPYAPMLAKVRVFVFPFACWIAYVLGLIAVTELLIARRSANRSARRIMQTLAASFVVIGIVILAALALGLGEGTTAGLYLKTVANLGSLLPSVLLAYYIYRYRYLELIIEESLVVATFAAVVLTIYLYGIRTVGDWMTSRYGVRQGVVEALLILALTLVAAPMRGWLERRFHKLFEREAALYREIVTRIGSQAGQYKQLPALLGFVEDRTVEALALRRVKIIVSNKRSADVVVAPQSRSADEAGLEVEPWIEQVLEISKRNGWIPVENESVLASQGFQLAYPLRREERIQGVLLIEGSPGSLTTDARAVLEVLAGQVAIAIEDCHLVEENVRLERKVAEGERLASLGQMAATVAHEIKNPLSAIKSIAQVMREDRGLSVEYARDLSLIVGETDRLSQSVTQLLSFARKESKEGLPQGIGELIRSVVGLFKANAGQQRIDLACRIETNDELSREAVAAIRDALSNLLLNALQATPAGGEITITALNEGDNLLIAVEDSGPGIPAKLNDRIWEPFFTTKQRGTGLGLAIVRKRMQEAGGSALMVPTLNGGGARFELRVPLQTPSPKT